MDPCRLDVTKEEAFEALKRVGEKSENVDHLWKYAEDEYQIGFVKDNSDDLDSSGLPAGQFVLFKVLDNEESWDYYFGGIWSGLTRIPFYFIKYKLLKSEGCYVQIKQWRIGPYREERYLEFIEELNLDPNKYKKGFKPESKAVGFLKEVVKCCLGLFFLIFMYSLGANIAKFISGLL